MSDATTIAQLSDVHLGPIAGFQVRHWNLKRFTGYINWRRNRRDTYRADVLARIVADLATQSAHHIAVTGDLANIGLPAELAAGARWLATLGPPERVSVIPGNHDIYSRSFGGGDAAARADPGMAIGVPGWSAYMTSNAAGKHYAAAAAAFPYVRIVGGVALIGVNSAIPTPPFIAAGLVGEPQRRRLAAILDLLGRDGLFRLVMIHHPPLPGRAPASRSLGDAAALGQLLGAHRAELVIHGHNHRNMLASVVGAAGPVAVIGAPSASLGRRRGHEDLARYNTYRIATVETGWTVELIGRGLAEPDGPVVELERKRLSVARPPQTKSPRLATDSVT